MYVILLISTIAFSVLFHGMETRCAVGLLDDSKGYMIKLTFMSETRKYNLRNIIETISTDRSYDTLYATCNLLETGVVALFGPQSESNHDIVQTVCDSKDVPHVQNRWDGKPERSSFTVNLYPHSQTLGAALADLVDARSWDTFAVFYDDYDSFCRVSEILKRDRKYFVALRQLDAERTGIYRSVLREVSKQNYKNYVVDCSLTCLSNFLLQAQQIGLMTSEHAYVISNPDLHTIDLEPYKYSETNITWLRLVDPDSDAAIDLAKRISKEQRHLDFDDELQEVLSHDIRSDMALLADGLQLLNMSLKSLPNNKKCASALSCGDSSSWYHGATFLSSLKMTSFDGVTGHVELNSMGYRDKFQLDIMELREGGIIKTGTWNTEHGVAPLPAHLEEEETIENNTFNVMVTKTPPFCMLKESEGPLIGNDRYEGFAIDIIHELSVVEKFNYTIKIRDDNKNGDYDSATNDWSGMIGDVMKGVTDLAISDLTITAERGSAVDFTMPFMYLGISILYKKPSKAPPNFFSFAAPFATEVWIYIGVAYFIVSVSLFIMGRLCTSEWTNPYPCVDDPEYLVNQFSFRNSLWFMLGSLLQQGSEIAPIAYATRMTAGSWWFFTLIMVATYTANLAAFLAIETPDKPFSDVYGLVKNAPRLGIKYGAKAKGATETFFRDTKNPDLEPIFKYMNSNADAMVADNDKGVSRANSERYAFFMESVSIEYATQRNCNLTKVGDQLDEKGYGIAMRKRLIQDDNDQIKKLAFYGKAEELGLESEIISVTPFHSYNTLSETCHIIEAGVVAVFGPQTEENSQIVETVCNHKDIPHIESRWNNNPKTVISTINMYPHGPTLSKAFADLVEMKYDQSFTIFYEDNEGLARISDILKREREFSIYIRQLETSEPGNYRPMLQEVRRAGHTHFVIDCHIDNLPHILQQAQQVGLMTTNHFYIITNLDLQTIDLEPYKFSESNITGFRLVNAEAEATKRLARLINKKQRDFEMDPNDIEPITPNMIRVDTALMVDGMNLLKIGLKDLPRMDRCVTRITCNDELGWSHGSSAINSMKMSSFNGVTGHVKLDPEGFRTEFDLDVIELNEHGLEKTATWNITQGLNFKNVVDSGNLENETFIVITTLTEPYGMMADSAESLTGNAQYEGFAIDLIHELSLIEKFTYIFKIRHDKSNGSKNKITKQWDGMIGDVINGVADLAITDLTITSEREEAVDFTSPFMDLGISILYQKPQKAPPNFFSFAEPFAVEVWLWLAGAYFVVSISLFVMGRLCPSEWTNPYPCVEEPEFLINQFSLRNSFWFTIGSLAQQGTEIAPIAYATRMTAGIWWFFTLIMVSSYTANLAAFLATENPDTPFTNVYELIEKAPKLNIKYGAKNKGATMNFFRDSPENSDFRRIYDYMIENEKDVMTDDNIGGVLRAEKEPYAFFMESVSIEYEIQRHCNLSKVGDLLDEKGYGIAMRKNSPYRHKLSTAILKLQENGKIAELKRKWWEERKGGGQCSGEPESQDAKPLTLKNVGGVFWVTVGGTVTAVVLVFIEMILHVMKESIKYKVPVGRELKEELKFYMKFKGLVKPVRIKKSHSKSPTPKSDKSEESNEGSQMQQQVTYGFLPDITNNKTPLD